MKQTNLMSIVLLATAMLWAFNPDARQSTPEQFPVISSKAPALTMCKESHVSANGMILSKEEQSQNGTFTMEWKLIAQDTLWIDSFLIDAPSLFTFTIGNSSAIIFNGSAFNTQYLLPGQEATCQATVTYYATTLPFYPKQIAITHYMHNNENNGVAKILGMVYFTPYSTTEVWDITDFNMLPRVWQVEQYPEPARIYVPLSSIPISTKPAESAITQNWQRNYQLQFVDGLAYAIQMEAIHPDSIIAERERDSIEEASIGNSAIENRFRGRVTGTIKANIINDNGGNSGGRNIGLKGIKVQLFDDDGFNKNDEFASGYTDGNGHYELWYDKYQPFTDGSEVELFIRISSENNNSHIMVVKPDLVQFVNDAPYGLTSQIKHIGKGYKEVDFGVWQLDKGYKEPFLILNWANLAVDFLNGKVGAFSRQDLKIYLNKNNSHFLMLPFHFIELETEDIDHETVIWHEFGHYVMANLSGISPFVLANGGDHSTKIESANSPLAWSEGWATGFMAMIDQHFKDMDGEYGWYTYIQGDTDKRKYNLEFRDRKRLNAGTPSNGLRSEYHISCTIYDLYDGTGKFPSGTNASSYKDQPSGGGLNNTGYDVGFEDDLELTPLQIFQPLINAKNSNSNIPTVTSYFNLLVAGNPCIASKIQKVFTQNGVLDNTVNQSSLTDVLSTDKIGTVKNVYESGLSSVPYIHTYTTDIPVLDGIIQSYNYAAGVNYNYDRISDNLTIKNGAILGINNDMPAGFNGGSPLDHTSMHVEACSNTVTVDNGGSLIVGGTYKYGTLTIEDNSVLHIKSNASVSVGWGCKIIVKNGGSIIYDGNPALYLNQEGVIEIQDGGKLIIGDNAKFQWTGLGYLKINTTTKGVSNILASSWGNGAKFEQSGAFVSGGYNQKLIEVTNGSLSVDANLTHFKLLRGLVLMGPSSMFDVAAPMYLGGIKMNTLQPNTQFDGIWVYGQQNTAYLSSCAVDNAFIGLRVFSSKGQANVATVYSTNFNNCTVGVLVYGKSAKIVGGSYWQNKTGIFLSGAENTSTVTGITSYYNRSAIDVVGSGTDLLETKGVRLYENFAVGAFMVNGKIAPTCSRIYNNYPLGAPSDGNNILLREFSFLDIEPYGTKDGGRNDLGSDLGNSVLCTMGASGFALNKGHTVFKSPNGLSFYGMLRNSNFPLPLTTFLASENVWDNGGASPVYGIHYLLDYSWMGSTAPVVIDDPSPLIRISDLSTCSKSGTWDDWNTGGKPSQLIGGGCNLQVDGTVVDSKMKEGLIKVYDINPDYANAVFDFASIVREWAYRSYSDGGQTQCADVAELAYREGMKALGKGIADGSIERIFYQHNPVGRMLDAQEQLKLYYQNTNFGSKYFQISLDQALVYRLINDRYYALEKIQQLRNLSLNETETALTNYYECLVSNEMVIESSTNKLDYMGINDCRSFLNMDDGVYETRGERPEDPVWEEEEGYGKTGSSFTSDDKPLTKQKNRAREIIDLVQVFPNPANNLINVKLQSGMEANEIRMMDIMGKTVQVSNKYFSGQVTLDINLESGIYFLEIANNGKTLSRQKVLITK